MNICGYELLPNLDGRIVATLLGVSVGFACSEAATFFRRRNERNDKKLEHAEIVFLKTCVVINNVNRVSEAHLSQLHQIDWRNEDHIWKMLMPVIGSDDLEVKLDFAELRVFLRQKRSKDLNRIFELWNVAATITGLSNKYRLKRDTVTEAMVKIRPPKMVGNEGQHKFTPEELAPIMPEMVALDKLAKEMLEMMERASLEAKTLSTEIGPILKELVNDKRFTATLTTTTP